MSNCFFYSLSLLLTLTACSLEPAPRSPLEDAVLVVPRAPQSPVHRRARAPIYRVW